MHARFDVRAKQPVVPMVTPARSQFKPAERAPPWIRGVSSPLIDLSLFVRAVARRTVRVTLPSKVTRCEDAAARSRRRGGSVNAEEVVRAELDAWSSLDADQIMAYFAPDATWLPGLRYPTSSGAREIRRAVEGFLEGMIGFDVEFVHVAVSGDVVLTERVDRITLPNGTTFDARGMGTFEVTEDKITAWRDYFSTPGVGE